MIPYFIGWYYIDKESIITTNENAKNRVKYLTSTGLKITKYIDFFL